MNEKIKWLRNKLLGLNMQGIIITNPVNIRYLTNIDAEGIFLVNRKENIFITDSRYIEHVNSTLTIEDGIVVVNSKDLSLEDYENFFIFCENVGFEENHLTYAKYKEYMHKFKINNFEETEGIIEKQRMIKEPYELEAIKRACKITDDCFDYLKGFIKVGMTEKEVANEIERFFLANGAEDLAFDTIVASGKNSSMPHAVPTDKQIEAGDPITIDMGCKVDGYCSDMTRTIFMGFVPPQIKPVYDFVLKTQMQVIEMLKEGTNIKNISKMVDSSIKLNGFEVMHSLGHGVGLEVHEYPFFGNTVDFLLKENNVITDEPGVYIPNKFGVRIEDTLLINKYSATSLTKSDKNYVVI
ncbi:MAG: aminopeptidase P family protein [Clostridia bacterium]|nr:aminopeptidase P family protein [Clostridia bacterium]